ncbi:hypothetical protein ACFL6B_06915, partial [Thermodesulfobacteriota bacterium]
MKKIRNRFHLLILLNLLIMAVPEASAPEVLSGKSPAEWEPLPVVLKTDIDNEYAGLKISDKPRHYLLFWQYLSTITVDYKWRRVNANNWVMVVDTEDEEFQNSLKMYLFFQKVQSASGNLGIFLIRINENGRELNPSEIY